MNYYEVLGLELTCSPKDIQTAYRKLAKQYHPDNGGNVDKFHTVSEAYDVLKDPHKRAQFDNINSRRQNIKINSNDVFDDDVRDELWNTFQDVRERNGCKETGLAPSIWMGGLGTCTQAHYDVLDNIFIQLHGEKQFHLWPPSDIMSLHFFPDAHSRSRKS